MEFLIILLVIVGLFFGFVFWYCDKMKKEKGYEEAVIFSHVEGIPGIGKDTEVMIYLYPDKITVNDIQIISLTRIKKALFISQQEIVEKQKNALLRGVGAGIVFGPLGAIIGAISGIGSKTLQENVFYFSVEFENTEGELKHAVFILKRMGALTEAYRLTEKINNKIGYKIQDIIVPHEI